MHAIYRISDRSYPKRKVPGATKENCLKNFLNRFHSSVTVIFDRCDESLKLRNDLPARCQTLETDLGNAGSFLSALDYAHELNDDVIYFVEDDYLHKESVEESIEEGLTIGDYVTLYDHPDKYSSDYDFGETSKVFRKKSHWRYTISTCMTFAATRKTINEDREIWNSFLTTNHPQDHKIFVALRQKGRNLCVQIPGSSCHMDLTWGSQNNGTMFDYHGIEDWAISEMISLLEDQLEKQGQGNMICGAPIDIRRRLAYYEAVISFRS